MGAYTEHYETYLRDGWTVAPLDGGRLFAFCEGSGTDEEDQAADWADDAPDANIGVTIPPDTVVVTVLKDEHGPTAFVDLCREHKVALPRTRCVSVPRGGLQIWFRGNADLKGAVADGIYLNVHPAVVPAPPSKHPNGKVYQALNELDIAPLPEQLARQWSVRPRKAAPASSSAKGGPAAPVQEPAAEPEVDEETATRLCRDLLGAVPTERPASGYYHSPQIGGVWRKSGNPIGK